MSTRNVTRVGNIAWPDCEPGKLYLEKETGLNLGRLDRDDVLRVMAVHLGGQIRGYERSKGETTWRPWLPMYTGDWPQMDQAVADLVGEPVIGFTGKRHEPRRASSAEQLSLGGVS